VAKIDLRKNSVNANIPLTLAEKTTISNPYYLFEFQNDTTKVKYYQIFTDVSTVPIAQRVWNLFNIEVVNSGSGANKIILGNVGKYHYIIYEQASSSNLNPAGLTIVERGIMELVDSTEVSIYVQHENIVTYVAHEQ
jgi:hypothetical protein